MKILVGAFQCESNTFSAAKAGTDSFYILHGEEAKKKLFASHVFEEAGFEVVPLVYAVSLPSGMVTRAGESDFLLKIFRGTGLKTLFTSLYDPDAVAKHANAPTVVCRGKILGFVGEESGEGVVVRDGNVDIVYSTVRTSFTMKEHFAAMGLNPADYDVVVVKQGYLWPGAASLAASQIFCMTPGTATNDFSTLPFKNLAGEYYFVKPE